MRTAVDLTTPFFSLSSFVVALFPTEFIANLKLMYLTGGSIENKATFSITAAKICSYVRLHLTGINRQIAVDAAYFPVVSSTDPRSVGLPQDTHDNSMLSCLLSGFLCPLSDSAAVPQPGSCSLNLSRSIFVNTKQKQYCATVWPVFPCRGDVGDGWRARGPARRLCLGPLSPWWGTGGSCTQQSVQSCRVLSAWAGKDRQTLGSVRICWNCDQHSVVTPQFTFFFRYTLNFILSHSKCLYSRCKRVKGSIKWIECFALALGRRNPIFSCQKQYIVLLTMSSAMDLLWPMFSTQQQISGIQLITANEQVLPT